MGLLMFSFKYSLLLPPLLRKNLLIYTVCRRRISCIWIVDISLFKLQVSLVAIFYRTLPMCCLG